MPVLSSLRKITDMTLDVHLMIDRPLRYVRDFAKAGADIIVFHVEADEPQNIFEAISVVKDCGKKVGLAIKPKTPAEVISPYLDLLDMALVMTVEPGFGGQSFMNDMLPKISAIRDMIEGRRLTCDIEVDGGIDGNTVKLCSDAGANVFVAGSYIFKAKSRSDSIESLRG
jgi:ribulose-phosphate 3-epimerase